MSPTRKRPAISAQHKAALAAGRSSGLAVRRYLEALEVSRPKRGRRPSPDTIIRRLESIGAQLETAEPLQRLHLLQERKELDAQLARFSEETPDITELEKAFVTVAKDYGDRKGLDYATWREVGVPVDVLRQAGIERTR